MNYNNIQVVVVFFFEPLRSQSLQKPPVPVDLSDTINVFLIDIWFRL